MDYKVKFCSIQIPNWDNARNYLKLSEGEQLSNFGPCYRELVKTLTKYLKLDDDKELIICSSGHTALMTAAYIYSNNTITLPAFTFASTLQALNGINVFRDIVDVDKRGYLALTECHHVSETIMAVCPISQIPDLDLLQKECDIKDNKLIIDGAATFGTPGIYNYGNAFCLSFHATKSFPVGECGALIIDKDKANEAKAYINFGLDEHRNIISNGLNAKVSDYTCAIALALFDEIGPALKARRMNSNQLASMLDKDIQQDYSLENTVYQAYPVFLPTKEQADKGVNQLLSAGYEVKKYYKPLRDLPNATDLYNRNICLPCHPGVMEKDIVEMSNIVNGVL